jgi:PKD repeat protein
VTLTVTDSAGQSSPPVSHQITVFAAPQAGFAIAGNGALDGTPVGFDASASADPGAGGPIAGYAWTFGDGTTATGVSISHAYSRPGSYPVTLTVTNGVGLSASVTQFVSIGDEAPSVTASVSPRVIAGQATSFNATASDPDSSIVAYAWDFGDHVNASSAHPTHTYKSAGHYTVTVTVTAGDGSRASTIIAVLVLAPGRITRVQIGQGSGGPALVISVNGPGHLQVGSHSISMRSGGSTRVRLTLSSGQLHALAAHRTVRIRITISFTPTVGPPSRRTLTISLRLPTRSRRYRVQLRQG